MPMKKDIISVKDVMVMETAASLNVAAILSGTGLDMLVLLQAANMTKVSSIPIPVTEEYDLYLSMAFSRKVTRRIRIMPKKKINSELINVINLLMSSGEKFFFFSFLLLFLSVVRMYYIT